MTMHMDFKTGQMYRVDEKICHFRELLPDDMIIFTEVPSGHPLLVPYARYVELYAQGEAVRLVAGKESVTPPFREDDRRMEQAKKRAFYLRRWDREQTSLGTAALERFIRNALPQAIREGVGATSPGALRRAIRTRGIVGERPLSAMLDRPSGPKGGRQEPLVEKAISETITYFYSARGVKFRDAWAFFNTTLTATVASLKIEMPQVPKEETLRLRIRGAETRDNIAKKFSPLVAAARYRGISEGIQTDRALQTVIIDGTPVDTWVVVDDETGAPLGRPYLTVAIDVHTRMILGIHIGFENESLEGIMACVLDILRPKTRLQERFPIVRRKHDGWGQPGKILVDNAFRQTGASFRDGMAGLGTDVEFAEIGTPQAKSIGERFFDTLNTKLFHKLEGGVPFKPDIMSRLQLDPAVTAVHSLAELEAMLHLVVVEDYLYVEHSTLMIQPALAWENSLKKRGRPCVADLREASRLLANYAEAAITREGIRFKNQIFHDQIVTSRILKAQLPGQKVRSQRRGVLSSGKALVKFKWDPTDASKIEVWNSKAQPPRYEMLPNKFARFTTGISFETTRIVRDHAKAAGLAFVSEEDRIAALDYVRRILDEAAPKLDRKRRIAAMRVVVPPLTLSNQVVEAVADATPMGTGKADYPIALAETGRSDHGFAPKGQRRGGRKATQKAVKTRREGPDPAVEKALEILEPKSVRPPRKQEPVVQDLKPMSNAFRGIADIDDQQKLIDDLGWE